MIYTCDACGFIFRRSQAQSQCPFCESTHVRESSAEEEKSFNQTLNFRMDKQKQSTNIVHMEERK